MGISDRVEIFGRFDLQRRIHVTDAPNGFYRLIVGGSEDACLDPKIAREVVWRVEAVKDYLVRAGVAKSRLRTISWGESRPAHDNSGEVTRRLSRRAHLRVLITR